MRTIIDKERLNEFVGLVAVAILRSDNRLSREIRDTLSDFAENGILKMEEDIEELPPVTPQPRWISVSERLPEEREWYLAVFKESDTGFQLIPRVADYIGRGENKWRLIDEDGLASEYRDSLECVAWMPLPEPYKEVRTDA